jgi:hypothetical protein
MLLSGDWDKKMGGGLGVKNRCFGLQIGFVTGM